MKIIHPRTADSKTHVGPVNLLYIIMFKIRKIKPYSGSVWQKPKSCHGDCISRMMGSINIERKGYGSIGCWTCYVTLCYDLDLGFSRSSFKRLHPWSKVANWHRMKGMWDDRHFCNFELWPHLWVCDLALRSSRSNFVKAASQEWEGQMTWNERDESIGCWTHHVTLSWDLDLGFSRSNFEKKLNPWGMWHIDIEQKRCESIIMGRMAFL